MFLLSWWIDLSVSDNITKFNQWIAFGIAGCMIALYYIVDGNALMCLGVSGTLLIYAIIKRGGILENRVTKFVNSISMEIYLSHMVIFRIIEKSRLSTMIGNGWFQYTVTTVLTICGAVIFSLILKKGIEMAQRILSRKVV